MQITKSKKVFQLVNTTNGNTEPDKTLYKSVSHVLQSAFSYFIRRQGIPKTGYEIIEYDLVEVGRIDIADAEEYKKRQKS